MLSSFVNAAYGFGHVTVLSVILRTTRCSFSSVYVASAISAHLRSQPYITVHTCMCTSDAVVLATFFGENAFDNVSAITRYFPGVYSPSHASVCVTAIAITSVAHHKAVSSISRPMAYDQFQRGLCVHRYPNEMFRKDNTQLLLFNMWRNCIPMLSSISMSKPLASILHSSPAVRRHRFRLWRHHFKLSTPFPARHAIAIRFPFQVASCVTISPRYGN